MFSHIRDTPISLISRMVAALLLFGLLLWPGSLLAQLFLPAGPKVLVSEIVPFGQEVWLVTDKGAFRIGEDGHPQQVGPVPSHSIISGLNIIPVGEEVWLATWQGAYRIGEDGRPQQVGPAIPVHTITQVEQEVWLATDQGAYRIGEDGRPQQVGPTIRVSRIVQLGKEVWLATDQGAYRIGEDGRPQQVGPTIRIFGIAQMGETVWLATEDGVYRIGEDGESHRATPAYGRSFIAQVGHEVWLATRQGAYRIGEDGRPQQVGPTTPVFRIVQLGEEVWLPTRQGAYRIGEDGRPQQVGPAVHVIDVAPVGQEVWLGTSSGLIRGRAGSIEVSLRSDSGIWENMIERLLPGHLWITGNKDLVVNYKLDGPANEQEGPESSFRVLVRPDTNGIGALGLDHYGPVEQTLLVVPMGRWEHYVAVRDTIGNFAIKHFQGYGLPALATLPMAVSVAWLLLLMLAVILAPYVSFFNGLVMNPFLRSWGSFGLLPVLLTSVPPVRRHVLSRYIRGIRGDQEFMGWRKRFVVPSGQLDPHQFGERITQERYLLILGGSGTGKTSYLRYLAACYAQGHAPPMSADGERAPSASARVEPMSQGRGEWAQVSLPLVPRRVVPVVVPLSIYRTHDPVAVISDELARYGDLTDAELSQWFLAEGGFLIFLDGLNEVDMGVRDRVASFVRRYSKRNFFCLASQTVFEFDWMPRLETTPLTAENVKSMIRTRLSEPEADALISTLHGPDYTLYSNPLDLEVAIDLFRRGLLLPRSTRELYRALIQPLQEAWREVGHTDFEYQLFKRAFESVRARTPVFCSAHEFPTDLIQPLMERRLVISRDDVFLFRHDRIRAYLAGLYMVYHWSGGHDPQATPFGDSTQWTDVLHFAVEEIPDSARAKDLAFRLLEATPNLAAILFREIEEFAPALSRDWADGFTASYGAVMLKRDRAEAYQFEGTPALNPVSLGHLG